MYSQLQGDLQAFNTVLATPPTWTPIPFPTGGSTIYGANLQWANSNTGASISSPSYFQTVVQPQLQGFKALGVQAVSVAVLFPVLYEPFYGSQAAYQPYLTFYTQVAEAVRAAGLKLIIDDEILFSNDTAAGWTNMNAFYAPLTWSEYVAARATMAATIEQYMQPDYLMLANEPDTEALQTGQTNLNNPADAAAMVQAEITAVKNYLSTATVSPYPKLGAGFGTWMQLNGTSSLLNYINAETALPLDYIDFHLLQIGTVAGDNFLNNSLTIAQMAAAAGKPVAITQAWMEDETNAEVNVLPMDIVRGRGPFTFWAPLNEDFMQTAQALANYTNMLYLVPQFPVYMFAQQTYGGTVANGGAANCTCTIQAGCSDYDIQQTENSLAAAADLTSVFTDTGVNYYNQLFTTPDTAPSVPPKFSGSAGFTTASLSWQNSTDNVGVAGYNLYRCTPPAAGQPCTGVFLATTTQLGYSDSSLTSGALYNYQVQAFNFANEASALTQPVSLQTFITSVSAATNLAATVVSPQEIDLSWSPPTSTAGLGSYQVYAGTSQSNLQEIAVRPSTATTFKDLPLAAGTTYYFGIVAVAQGVAAPMTPVVSAATLPLPNPPSSVGGKPTPYTTTEVGLAWKEILQTGDLPITFYEIYEGTTPGSLTKIATATAATYTATSLSPNTTYYFEIVAADTSPTGTHDYSIPSDQIAVTTNSLPAAPVNVVAANGPPLAVTVTWSEIVPSNGLSISSYTVFRGLTPTSLTSLGTASATPPLQHIDTTVVSGTTYYYAVEASDDASPPNVSPMSATAEVTTPTLPAAPVNVTAMPSAPSGETQLTVTWTENNTNGITSYTINWGTSPGSLTNVATRTTTTFTDTGLSPNTTYYFAITANSSGGSSPPGTGQGTTAAIPAAPSSPLATVNSATEITLTWSEILPTNGQPIASYAINWGTSPGSLTNLATRTATTFADTPLTPNTTYYFQITATDIYGDVSPASAVVQATTPPLPNAPSNVGATSNSAGTQVTVTWSETLVPNGLPLKYFFVFRGPSPTSLTKLIALNATSFSYVDSSVLPGNTYYYGVEAVDDNTPPDISPMSSPLAQVTTP
jgi:fibronectin type 3 domain-containing protein